MISYLAEMISYLAEMIFYLAQLDLSVIPSFIVSDQQALRCLDTDLPIHDIPSLSTVKSDQKFRFSETISFKRFLNVILVLKVSLTNAEFFQKF